MKKFKATIVSICCLILASCQSSQENLGDFKLLPSPQQFTITGSSDLKFDDVQYYFSPGIELPAVGVLLKNLKPAEEIDNAQVVFTIDEALEVKAEGYTLDISGREIVITGKDVAGLLYGFMTLEQLMEDAKDQNVNLPGCTIKDFPQLSYRAIHIDVKHHRETTEYYYRLMDRLAKYKINAIIAEVEDKIKYERQPEVGSADALSIEEWRKLSEYARVRNIQISPLVQGLGHASFILKHEKYRDLRDDPESDWAFNPLNPETYEVQFDLYLDAIAATPYGKYLHIGGDEVHTTGRGSGRSALELQLIWLNKVCQFAEKQGRIPIFWDDMPLKHAGVYRPMFNPVLTKQDVDSIWKQNGPNLMMFIDQFPKNCIYMRWNYQTPGTYGNLKTMDWFTSNGFKVMGATAGQTRWVLMPQNQSNFENIRSFALSSIEKGLDGLLLTLWDDDSPHFELYMRGIMGFAEYSWSGDKRTIQELKTVHRQRAFGKVAANEKYAFIDNLEVPVGYWKNALVEDGVSRNNLVSMDLSITEGIIDVPDPDNKGAWKEKYVERLDKARELLVVCDSISDQINEMKQVAVRNQYTLQVYEQVNDLIKFSLGALIAMESYDTPSEVMNEEEALKDIEMLTPKFTQVRSQFEKVYSKTRILNKSADYILDQDHHHHSANQSTSFDWQFVSELLLLEKLETDGSSNAVKAPGQE